MLNKSAMILPKLFGGSLLALALVASHDATGQSPAPDGATAKPATQLGVPKPRVAPRLLAVAPPNALATIKGNATSTEKGAVTNTTVRLRDARTGRIVGLALTDKDGVFTFRGVDPGSYIAEVMDQSQSVVAASQLIGANAGEVASVVLKLPTTVPQIGKLLGSTTPSNATLNSQAVAGGVAAVTAVTPISER